MNKTEIPDGWINLRVDVDGQKRTFSYSMDGENYIEGGNRLIRVSFCAMKEFQQIENGIPEQW